MADKQKYFVVQTIWHEGQRRHAYPGELVELDHLTEEQVSKLTAGNIIVAEAAGRGRFTRNLNQEQPPLPPEIVALAQQQAAEAAAHDPATAQPEAPARKRSARKSKKE